MSQPSLASVGAGIRAAREQATPFTHWLMHDLLAPATRREIVDLPIAAPAIGDTQGKRETHNQQRVFFNPAAQATWPICRDIAGLFQDPATIALLQDRFGAQLNGSSLRIEYCLDHDGFWLERHTDIGAKLLTFLIYLSDQDGAEAWGTDLYDGEGRHAGRAPAPPGSGLAFVPGEDTWHGFERRPIDGIRRSLIINYVVPEWRARHELAFPGQPVHSSIAD